MPNSGYYHECLRIHLCYIIHMIGDFVLMSEALTKNNDRIKAFERLDNNFVFTAYYIPVPVQYIPVHYNTTLNLSLGSKTI